MSPHPLPTACLAVLLGNLSMQLVLAYIVLFNDLSFLECRCWLGSPEVPSTLQELRWPLAPAGLLSLCVMHAATFQEFRPRHGLEALGSWDR